MTRLSTTCPAKINLYLDILRRRADGYHDLRTMFLAVGLADTLTLQWQQPEPRPGDALPNLRIDGPYADASGLPEKNLVLRAALAVEAAARRVLPRDAGFHLTKNIPAGAGLGGGSSDAAAAIRLTNQALGSPLGKDALHIIAATIGSDCAFFLGPPAAEATGRGEILTPIQAPAPLTLLIAWPRFASGTREAYAALRPEHLGPRTDADAVRHWLASGAAGPPPGLHNTFEPALDPVYTALPRLRETMLRHGALTARLSGSGSAVFGLFPDETTRNAAEEALADSCDVFRCTTDPHTPG